MCFWGLLTFSVSFITGLNENDFPFQVRHDPIFFKPNTDFSSVPLYCSPIFDHLGYFSPLTELVLAGVEPILGCHSLCKLGHNLLH